MDKALPHGFESTLEIHDLAKVLGYQMCLSDMMEWIGAKEKAGFIISGDLLANCIIETTKELLEVNNLTNEIQSLIKPAT